MHNKEGFEPNHEKIIFYYTQNVLQNANLNH